MIFGGTFDPIHTAHLVLAESAADQLDLDRVLFVPSARPPHKSESSLSNAVHRTRMVELATEGNDRFALSRVELERKGRSYAIDTIRELSGAGAKKRPCFLIGTDSLADLSSWRDPDAILEEADVVVAPRPGYDNFVPDTLLSKRVRFLKTPMLDLSATMIRERVRDGYSIRYMVPDRVRNYIKEESLYRDRGSQ